MKEKIKDILGLTNILNDQIRKERKRTPWDHIFLREAILWSERSHDAETQCGCVLVRDHRVISTGYNGFMSGINDQCLPNLRPYKYDFMIHAEHNAILNCARHGICTRDATAYITGPPCNWCIQYMWQAGITNVIYTHYSKVKMIQDAHAQRVNKAILTVLGCDNEYNTYFRYWDGTSYLSNEPKMSFTYIPMENLK